MKYSALMCALGAMALLAGCSSVPPTSVHQPMSARPAVPVMPQHPNNGAIYQANNSKLRLFEEYRARAVGDTLTVSLEERLSATSKSNTKIEKSSDMSASVSSLNLPLVPSSITNRLGNLNVGTESENNMEGKGETGASNTFTGTITVTVIEVLNNGNMLVSGEKQVGINREVEFVRFSGVVNPRDIRSGNLVSSTRVADARIERKGDGAMDGATVMGWLAKFFLSALPF